MEVSLSRVEVWSAAGSAVLAELLRLEVPLAFGKLAAQSLADLGAGAGGSCHLAQCPMFAKSSGTPKSDGYAAPISVTQRCPLGRCLGVGLGPDHAGITGHSSRLPCRCRRCSGSS